MNMSSYSESRSADASDSGSEDSGRAVDWETSENSYSVYEDESEDEFGERYAEEERTYEGDSGRRETIVIRERSSKQGSSQQQHAAQHDRTPRYRRQPVWSAPKPRRRHSYSRSRRSTLRERNPPTPPQRQPRRNYWDELGQFESGNQQHPWGSLVPATRPYFRDTLYPTPAHPPAPTYLPHPLLPPPQLPPKELEPKVPTTAEAAIQKDSNQPVDEKSIKPPHTAHQRPPNKIIYRKAEQNAAVAQANANLSSSGADADVSARRVDLVYDPSQGSRDMTVSLGFEVEDDWEADLEEFCRLRRIGRFNEAKEHFRTKLEHVSDIPYIRVQYAEALQACGDYRGFQELVFPPEFPPGPSNETPEDRSRGKLVANQRLLDLLSQRSIPDYVGSAWKVVQHTLQALATETTMGSTEIQLLVLCLRVLQHLETCTHESFVSPAKVYATSLFTWRRLYLELVGESCIWDFRDLLVAAVPILGWQDTLEQFFETSHLPRAMDALLKDWSQPSYDEATTLGLLDLLTSLILQDPSEEMKDRNSFLLEHAKGLAEAVETNDPELMKSRPFVQWLLAKSVLAMEAPPRRPDGVRLEDFIGLKLDQGPGIHLPIFIPDDPSNSPHWDMLFSRSNPAQRRAVEVAARAAEELGDYVLQAQALKLLILQSQEPRSLMTVLGNLQLAVQGDTQGYISTCLSKYLVATDPAKKAELYQDLQKVEGTGAVISPGQCTNASLEWAWAMISRFLLPPNGGGDLDDASDGNVLPFLGHGIRVDNGKLPSYIADYCRTQLGISVSAATESLSLDQLFLPVHDEAKDQAALRDRFSRGQPQPPVPEQEPNSSHWRDSAHTLWPGMSGSPQLPSAAFALPPSGPPSRTPWPFYQGEQPDPLAYGVSPALHVNGWPDTWYREARRKERKELKETAEDNVHRWRKSLERPRTEKAHTRSDDKPGHDQTQKNDRNRANQPGYIDELPRAKEYIENSRTRRSRSRSSRTYEDRYASDNAIGSDDWSDYEHFKPKADRKFNVRAEHGVTKLDFPDKLLDGHGMTVLLSDRKDPRNLKAYIVEKGGNVVEAAVEENNSKPTSHPHRRNKSTPGKSEFELDLQKKTLVSFDVSEVSESSDYSYADQGSTRVSRTEKREEKGKSENRNSGKDKNKDTDKEPELSRVASKKQDLVGEQPPEDVDNQRMVKFYAADKSRDREQPNRSKSWLSEWKRREPTMSGAADGGGGGGGSDSGRTERTGNGTGATSSSAFDEASLGGETLRGSSTYMSATVESETVVVEEETGEEKEGQKRRLEEVSKDGARKKKKESEGGQTKKERILTPKEIMKKREKRKEERGREGEEERAKERVKEGERESEVGREKERERENDRVLETVRESMNELVKEGAEGEKEIEESIKLVEEKRKDGEEGIKKSGQLSKEMEARLNERKERAKERRERSKNREEKEKQVTEKEDPNRPPSAPSPPPTEEPDEPRELWQQLKASRAEQKSGSWAGDGEIEIGVPKTVEGETGRV